MSYQKENDCARIEFFSFLQINIIHAFVIGIVRSDASVL